MQGEEEEEKRDDHCDKVDPDLRAKLAANDLWLRL
jgi:hypothetical protein